jgi:hypothetical protein
MYHQFNIQQFCVLPTQWIYVFCVDLRTNSDYFTVQHWLFVFNKRDGMCSLRGTHWSLYIIEARCLLSVVKVFHRFTVFHCRNVARTFRLLVSRLQFCRCELHCYACYIYRPVIMCILSFVTEHLAKPCLFLFCPKTVTERTWRSELNCSKHWLIVFIVLLSHCFPVVTLCTACKSLLYYCSISVIV